MCSSSRPASASGGRPAFGTACGTAGWGNGSRDDLVVLKENIIIGHLSPAGTGMYRYQEVDVESDALPEPEPIPVAIEPSFESMLPGAFAESVPFTMGDID